MHILSVSGSLNGHNRQNGDWFRYCRFYSTRQQKTAEISRFYFLEGNAIVAISLASLKKTTGKANPLVLVYGPEKVGKTSLFAEFPSPVLIQTAGENPPADVSVDTFGEVADFESLMSVFEALFTEDHQFATLGIDAVDGVERIVWAETCRRNGWASLEEPGYGKGYIEADSVWSEFFSAVRGLNESKGMNIVLIGHTEIKQFDDPANGSYSRFQPNLHKRASDTLKAMCDVIAFVNNRVSITKEKGAFGSEQQKVGGSGQRIMYLEARPGFVAGNRYSMPDEITFKRGNGYTSLAKHLPGAEKGK